MSTQFKMTEGSLISVVDDDESIRESLRGLLKSLGYAVEIFSSAESFLTSSVSSRTHCLILDVRMPGMTGPELQQELKRAQRDIPIVFITAHGNERSRSRLIEDGAIDCLLKPFSEESLLKAIHLTARN